MLIAALIMEKVVTRIRANSIKANNTFFNFKKKMNSQMTMMILIQKYIIQSKSFLSLRNKTKS